MAKRSSGTFERVEKDFYATIDPRATEMLHRVITAPGQPESVKYYEPCAGQGDLIKLIEQNCPTAQCVGSSDISTGKDAFDLTSDDLEGADCIITNPPWSRNLLHDMIIHFKDLKPTFLLFDADWAMNKSSVPYLEYCYGIYPIGRLKWIPGTTMQSKDNCAWYFFRHEIKGPSDDTIFRNYR